MGAYCTLLTVTDTDISVPRARDAVIFSGVPSMLHRAKVSVVSLDETTGLVCYVVGDASAGDSASYETTCTPVGLFNGTVVKVGDDLVVDSDTTLDMSITAMSETAAIVCYLKNEERIGTCKGLVLSHGKDLTMGDARDITGTGAFKAYSDVDDCHRSGGFRWALFFPCSPGGACGLCGSSCAVIAPRVPAVTVVQPTFLVLAERAQAAQDPAFSGSRKC